MEKTNQNQMGTKPIASLIFTMGCPPIVSMFVQSMYYLSSHFSEFMLTMMQFFPMDVVTLI